MADKLAKLFEKNDKKKQSKSKSGLSTFTDPLSGETSFDMHAVKVSLCSTGSVEQSETVECASPNIGRADGNFAEWSNTKSSLFTEKEGGKTESVKFHARGRKKIGVDNIDWSQLPSTLQEETARANVIEGKEKSSDISKDISSRPSEAKEPKKFVARGRIDSTRCIQTPTAGFPENSLIKSREPSTAVKNHPESNVTKTFVARGKPGSTGTIESSSGASSAPGLAVGEKHLPPSRSVEQPGRYVPPSRR